MLKLNKFRSRKQGLSDLLPYAFVVDTNTIVNKDGSLSIGLSYYGNDLDSSTANLLEDLSDKTNQNLLRFGNGWCFHVDVVRKLATSYPVLNKQNFDSATALLIDEERRVTFNENDYFENYYVLTLTFLPSYEKHNLVKMLFSPKSDNYDNLFEEHLKQFIWNVDTFINNLSGYFKFKKLTAAEFVKHIHTCITGEYSNISLPKDCYMYLDVLLATKDIKNTKSGIVIGGKYVKTLTINGFPEYARPDILSELSKRSFEYRWNTRFIPLERRDAEKHLKKLRKFWRSMTIGFKDVFTKNPSPDKWVDGNAANMKNDIEMAMSENAGSDVRYGFYSSTIVIFENDIEILEEKCKDIISVLDGFGFAVRVETFHSIENYLGSLPSNTIANIDNVLLHTINLSHLMPLTSIWSGSKYHPSDKYPLNSPALVYCNTSGRTPFRLNLHVGDVGHSLIFGPTGAGKSTLLGLLAASQFKYRNSRVFVFDKKWSMLPLCYAMGGIHYDLLSEDQKQVSLCPLADLETEQDIVWANEYIQMLFELQDIKLGSNQLKEIAEAITIMASRTLHDRSLEQLKSNVQDKDVKQGLDKYIRMGDLLNGKQNDIKTKRITVFEMMELMNLGDRSVAAPAVLMCLFRQLDKEFRKGYPTMLILDECWTFLNNSYFSEKIIKWLKELRSFNVNVVFATQNLSDIENSGISTIIRENCLTKIFLPNPEAETETSKRYYKMFGLNDQQIRLIRTATMKRHYYYTSPDGCRMFELNLKQVQLQLIGRTEINDARLAKKLYLEDPDKFCSNWLRAVEVAQENKPNLLEWAKYWEELFDELILDENNSIKDVI